MKRVHLFIAGFVQGVFFRAYIKENAEKLDLGGWVKNLPDGRVAVLIEGSEEKIKKMVDLCRVGPLNAEVEKVEVSWEKPKGMTDFEIRR